MTFPLASAVLRLFRRRRRTFSTRTINGTWLVFAGPLVGIDEENLARRHPRHKGLASATVHEGSRGWTAAPRSDLLPASLLLSSTLTHPHQFYRDRNLQIDWSHPPPLNYTVEQKPPGQTWVLRQRRILAVLGACVPWFLTAMRSFVSTSGIAIEIPILEGTRLVIHLVQQKTYERPCNWAAEIARVRRDLVKRRVRRSFEPRNDTSDLEPRSE